ncbi:MAG: PAS domain S-box protein [Mariprofundaceae bacterium]
MKKNALKARAGLSNDGKTLANVRAQIDQRLKQINAYSQTMQQGESKSHIRAIAMDIERMLADKQRLIETYAAKTSVGKSETADMLAAISAIPTQHYIDSLDAALSNQRDQLAQTNGIYRTLLLMLSIVLLCYVTDFLLRLKRTRNHLEKAVAELKHQKFAMDQHAIVSITNAKGEITYANDLFCEACGYSRDELIGQHKDMINSGYHSKAFYTNISTMLSRGEVWHGVLSYRNKHQEHYWAHTTIVPFADSHGPEQYISISSDITDLKNAEQALQVSEIRYRSLVDAAPSAIAVHQDGKWVFINPAAMRLFGTEQPEELLGRPVRDFSPPTRPSTALESEHDELCDAGMPSSSEESWLRLNGESFEAEVTCIPVTWQDKPAVMVMANDISERQRVSAELSDQRRAMKALLDHAPIGIWMLGVDRRMKFTNKCFNASFGISERRFLEAEHYEELFPPEVARYWRASDESCFETKEVKHGIKIPCPDGKEHTFEIIKACVEDEQGNIQGIVGLAIDATERVEMEEEQRQMRTQIEHTQRLESMGVLAGGIAHDFNNILTAILGNASLAEMKLPADSQIQKHLVQIEKSADRAAGLCKQMLAYSGKGQFIIQPVNLSMLTGEMSDLLEVSIAKNINIQYNLDHKLGIIRADSAQIQQVIMNLIINASEAIGEDRGVITIACGTTEVQAEQLGGNHFGEPLQPGRYAYLEVSDTGCGMNQKIQAKIFDPFFTTKFTGRGLGMSAVLGIVRSHKGALYIDSSPGKGSSFKVLFPCIEAKPKPAGKVSDVKDCADWHGSGAVLVVDDEAQIRDIASMMLDKMGYSVLTAVDGKEGVDMFARHREEIDVVLLDMTMPKMNGLECLRQIKCINPEVKIILSSGYNEQDATKPFDAGELDGFIQKPYATEPFMSALRAVAHA